MRVSKPVTVIPRGFMPKLIMTGKNLEKGDEGKQKSRRARALRDENIDSLSVTIFYLQQKEYFLFEVLAWELFIKYVLKIWNI